MLSNCWRRYFSPLYVAMQTDITTDVIYDLTIYDLLFIFLFTIYGVNGVNGLNGQDNYEALARRSQLWTMKL